MWLKGKLYLKKMGGIILIASVVVWALGYFPREISFSKDYENLIALENFPEVHEQLILERDAEQQAGSYIGIIGKTIEPVIRPLGFDWKMGVSLVSGFAAKEIVISTMSVLYQAGDESGSTVSLQDNIQKQVYLSGPRKGEKVYSKLSGLSFLLFVLFYLPCIAVITAVGREAGSWKWSAFVLFYTTTIAWLVSFIVYQAGSMII
jgi:ferrous iron transport protein B